MTKSLSILIVDDDDSARTVFAVVLERAGHIVTQTGDGRQALALLRSQPFDVVLTDVIMPDIDGLEIVTAAKALNPRPRVVAMSGGSKYLGADFCLKLAGAMSGGTTLTKPFSTDELIAAVEGGPVPVET
ncbi:MAG: response regulator [Opitutaceae bacterium]|nr:response regulator [Opitutaceae bacterium]